MDGVFKMRSHQRSIYRGRNISFVRHVNDLLIKYSIPLALFAAVRTFADGVNAEFTVTPKVIDLFAFRHLFTIRFFGKD